MTFKEMASRDIGKVFMVNTEFMDTHIIDGIEMRVIVDANELVEREKGSAGTHTNGLYSAETMIYVPVEDFGRAPKIGSNLMLDGKSYFVREVINEDGIYSMTLEANRI